MKHTEMPIFARLLFLYFQRHRQPAPAIESFNTTNAEGLYNKSESHKGFASSKSRSRAISCTDSSASAMLNKNKP